ncbi:MAG: pilus assembly protein [Candidatus Wallbacteria bacterium]|nr:pilus assembly protein [Candidatus Wallbacteria bacterium]
MSFERRRKRGGQAMMELAILLPFMLLIMSAIIEFGFYMYDFIGVNAALRAGASAAVQCAADGTPVHDDNQLRRVMHAAHGPVNELLPAEIDLVPLTADPAFGGAHTSVTVTIDHRHDFIFPAFLFEGRGSIQIRAALKTLRIPGTSS